MRIVIVVPPQERRIKPMKPQQARWQGRSHIHAKVAGLCERSTRTANAFLPIPDSMDVIGTPSVMYRLEFHRIHLQRLRSFQT